MYAHDDDDSRGSVGSPIQGEFEHGSIPDGEDDLDEEYNDEADNSGADIDHGITSEDEFDCKLVMPQPLSVVKSTSPELPTVPGVKKIARRKPAAAKHVPVAKTRKPDSNAQAVNTGTSEKKKTIIVARKRPIGESLAKSDSVEFTKKASAAKRKPVSKLKDPEEEGSRVLPNDESRIKPKAAVKKSCKVLSTSTDEPLAKKGRRDVKPQPEEAPSPPATNDGCSTPIAVEAQVHALPQLNVPRKIKTPIEMPAKSYPALNSESADRRFWMETLACDFESPGYKALLKNSQFTEQQTSVLQQSFYQLCRKLSDISTYSDRFMKTHKCLECEFSISHQCVSIDFTQYVPASANVTGVTNITPQSTTMCICQFGFFHSHATQPRVKLANSLSLKNISRMLELNRSVSVRCPRCHMNVVMKNRNNDVCCDFANWNSLEGANRRQFINSLENRLQTSKMSRPYLNELYTCNRQCCQLFHRCAENAVADNNISMRPH